MPFSRSVKPGRLRALRAAGIAAALASFSLLVSTACGGQSPQPTPTPPSAPATSPATSAPSPSPSPGLAPSPSPAASTVPSPSAIPTPSPTPIALDEYPFAVMIDNIIDARPHVGLGNADVVYEAPAEGGIPRLMPIFLHEGSGADQVGPVRSARHYFVYLANEYDAPLVHIGASPQGFNALAETGLPDVDETRDHPGFFRSPRRYAPHNAFIIPEAIRDGLRARGVKIQPTQGGLVFGVVEPGGDPARQVRIDYPGGEHYVVQYAYDEETHTYVRSMDGQPHRDGVTGETYAARSIVVQYAPTVPIPGDTAGRMDVQLVGSGEATLFVDGAQIPLTWQKTSVHQATHFTRVDGKPFALPEGQVWIQIVPLETAVHAG